MKDIQSDVQKDTDDTSYDLGHELILRFCAQQMPSLEIARHVARLTCTTRSNNTPNQIESLSLCKCLVCAFGDTTEDELGGFGNG